MRTAPTRNHLTEKTTGLPKLREEADESIGSKAMEAQSEGEMATVRKRLHGKEAKTSSSTHQPLLGRLTHMHISSGRDAWSTSLSTKNYSEAKKIVLAAAQLTDNALAWW